MYTHTYTPIVGLVRSAACICISSHPQSALALTHNHVPQPAFIVSLVPCLHQSHPQPAIILAPALGQHVQFETKGTDMVVWYWSASVHLVSNRIWHPGKRPPSVIVCTCTRTFFVSCLVPEKASSHGTSSPPCSSGDRRRLPVTRQVIDPPRFKELTPRLASASDQATWWQLRKRRDLDRATRVLGFARILL